MALRLVCISDTHARHRDLSIPEGDVLIHAGDITEVGHVQDLIEFDEFLAELPHPHKLVIAGNHDFCLERHPEVSEAVLRHCTYLCDSLVAIRGVSFYGSPWQPWYFDWAFNLRRGPEIRAKWDLIRDGTDVLITHGPPHGFGDRTARGERVGCEELLAAVRRVRPRVHVFGHIHEDPGVFPGEHTTFINASSCDLHYRAVQAPIVFDLE